MLTGAGRALSLTQRTARKLGDGIDVYEFDVTVPEHGPLVRDALASKWGHVDGVLHAIGFAPASCLGDDFLEAPWEDVAVAMQISTYSLKTLVDAFLPLMGSGGSFVGLDFDNQQAWPAYNWMGVAKSALQSVSRYLAKELGPQGHPLQSRRRRTDQDDGRQVDPGLRPVRGRLGRPGPARLGRDQLRTGRQGLRRAPVRLVPGHDRRDHPRRRRVPRHRRLTRARSMSWIPDEIGYAGLEHLDADYVAGYDAKAQVDPSDDIEILTAHGLGPGTTIVDLGAGTGVFTAAAAATGADVIAVDVSPAMVRHLRSQFADRRNVTVVHGRIPDLRTRRPAGRVRLLPQRAASTAGLLEGRRARAHHPLPRTGRHLPGP